MNHTRQRCRRAGQLKRGGLRSLFEQEGAAQAKPSLFAADSLAAEALSASV